jgi:hypothetical protein
MERLEDSTFTVLNATALQIQEKVEELFRLLDEHPEKSRSKLKELFDGMAQENR